MNNNEKEHAMKKKTIVLFLALATLLALPATSLAQNWEGSLFGTQTTELYLYGLFDPREATEGLSLGGTQIEDPTAVPLGNGIAILVAAGVGFVALKRKEDKQ